MNDMWTALERYQPFADKHGFGAQWLKMTTDRTAEAAEVAVWAAADAAWAASDVAAEAEEAAAEAAAWAIKYINRAIALEKTT